MNFPLSGLTTRLKWATVFNVELPLCYPEELASTRRTKLDAWPVKHADFQLPQVYLPFYYGFIRLFDNRSSAVKYFIGLSRALIHSSLNGDRAPRGTLDATKWRAS